MLLKFSWPTNLQLKFRLHQLYLQFKLCILLLRDKMTKPFSLLQSFLIRTQLFLKQQFQFIVLIEVLKLDFLLELWIHQSMVG